MSEIENAPISTDEGSASLISEKDVMPEPKIEPINPNSIKSEIILCIYAHGKDLCNSVINTHHGKLQNTLFFSLASKGQPAVCSRFGLISGFELVKKLYMKLNQQKRLVSDVIKELKDNYYSEEEPYNYKKELELGLERPELQIMKESTKKQQIIQLYNDMLESYKKKLIATPRLVTINREYDITEIEDNPERIRGIFVLDIRNPKNEEQNDFQAIFESLNNSKRITLSEILTICYLQYNFDYVSIFDFACRISDGASCENNCCLKSECLSCADNKKEIDDGMVLLQKYEQEQLGGIKKNKNTKKRKTKKYRNKKKQRNSIKTKKNIKTYKKKLI